MGPSEYKILPEQDLDTEKEQISSCIEQPRHVSRAAYWFTVLSFILFCFNTIWAYQQYSTRPINLTGSTLYGKSSGPISSLFGYDTKDHR